MTMTEDEIREKEEILSQQKKKIQTEEIEIRKCQIEQRMETLKKLYSLLIENYDKDISQSVYLNDVLLYATVSSYYDDIYRFKDYSCSKWADNHKQAGYTIKWISKFRPIQISSKSTLVDQTILTINAVYALFAGFSFLDRKVSESITSHYYNHLIYLLIYRNISGKQLASLFYVLECAVNNTKP